MLDGVICSSEETTEKLPTTITDNSSTANGAVYNSYLMQNRDLLVVC